MITGASSGLGRESARALAAAGARVILAARNTDALGEADRWIHAEVPDAKTATVQLDLTSLTSVRTAAGKIREATPVIDILMNNAGVMFTPFSRTQDGFEIQLGTNHLGHFEFTRLLTPQLTAAAGARIVILSSGGHVMGDVDVDDPNWEHREYDKFAAYGASKTANILHAKEADRRLCEFGIRAYAVHPGTVATSLARYMSKSDFSQLRKYAVASGAARGERTDGYLDFTTPEYGSATQVWAAVSPELADRGGEYLESCGVSDRGRALRGRRRACRGAVGSLREVMCDNVTRTERRKQEVREKILAAAFDLFLAQGVACDQDRGDLRACRRGQPNVLQPLRHSSRHDARVGERRLVNLHDVFFDRGDEAIPVRLIGVFDDIAIALVKSGDTYREMIGEMLAASGYGIQRGFNLHDTFVELVKEGVARGEVSERHDAETLADIIVGALSGGIVNWTADVTYSLETNLHNLGVALAELLTS